MNYLQNPADGLSTSIDVESSIPEPLQVVLWRHVMGLSLNQYEHWFIIIVLTRQGQDMGIFPEILLVDSVSNHSSDISLRPVM